MRIMKSLVFTVALMFGSVANATITLWLDPSDQSNVSAGDDISLTLMISGLGDFSPTSLGTFDVDVNFDASVLSFTGYSLFDGLGDVGLFEADDFSWGEYASGAVNLFEISYLFDFELDALQPGSFALADLFFHVDDLSAGESTMLSLFANDLSDGEGNMLTAAIGDDAVISASQPQVPVPAPASMTLLGLALLSMFFRLNKSQLLSHLACIQQGTSQQPTSRLQLA